MKHAARVVVATLIFLTDGSCGHSTATTGSHPYPCFVTEHQIMKITKLSIACGLVAMLVAGTALAADVVPLSPTESDVSQPASVRQITYDYNDYLYFPQEGGPSDSPSDAPPPPVEEDTPVLEPGCIESCEPSCGNCCRRRWGDRCLGDPWTLPQPCALSCRGIEVGGWISAGIFGNVRGARGNGPLAFNDVGDGFTLNQLWVYIDRATDTGGYGVDLGGHVDYVFGVDGPDTQAFGDGDWDATWDTARDYGSAIPQLYAELAINNLTIKGGRFYTIIGWEVVQAPDNFFYSHAYTMYYGEPFTHTGFLASYELNDKLTVHGGWTDGWDNGWRNILGASTILGGVTLNLSDNATLAWACSGGGQGRAGGVDRGDVYMNSIVFELAVTNNFTYVLQHDLGSVSGLGVNNSQWYGVNQYFQYQLNERWAAGIRLEWFRDDDGARVPVDAVGNCNPGNYYEVTWGLNYRPHANVMIRPELRYDWFDGANVNGLPFNDGADSYQLSGGCDFIFTF